MWNLVPWPGIEPQAPCIGSMETSPLDHQGSPYRMDFLIPPTNKNYVSTHTHSDTYICMFKEGFLPWVQDSRIGPPPGRETLPINCTDLINKHTVYGSSQLRGQGQREWILLGDLLLVWNPVCSATLQALGEVLWCWDGGWPAGPSPLWLSGDHVASLTKSLWTWLLNILERPQSTASQWCSLTEARKENRVGRTSPGTPWACAASWGHSSHSGCPQGRQSHSLHRRQLRSAEQAQPAKYESSQRHCSPSVMLAWDSRCLAVKFHCPHHVEESLWGEAAAQVTRPEWAWNEFETLMQKSFLLQTFHTLWAHCHRAHTCRTCWQ